MADQMIFKRCEIKYMLDITQAELLKNQMKQYMTADEHGMSTCLLYTSPSPRDISGTRMPSSA